MRKHILTWTGARPCFYYKASGVEGESAKSIKFAMKELFDQVLYQGVLKTPPQNVEVAKASGKIESTIYARGNKNGIKKKVWVRPQHVSTTHYFGKSPPAWGEYKRWNARNNLFGHRSEKPRTVRQHPAYREGVALGRSLPKIKLQSVIGINRNVVCVFHNREPLLARPVNTARKR